jgi:hypothetical protein
MARVVFHPFDFISGSNPRTSGASWIQLPLLYTKKVVEDLSGKSSDELKRPRTQASVEL